MLFPPSQFRLQPRERSHSHTDSFILREQKTPRIFSDDSLERLEKSRGVLCCQSDFPIMSVSML
jgi:hypothetical protein